jgi:hypothetical protein
MIPLASSILAPHFAICEARELIANFSHIAYLSWVPHHAHPAKQSCLFPPQLPTKASKQSPGKDNNWTLQISLDWGKLDSLDRAASRTPMALTPLRETQNFNSQPALASKTTTSKCEGTKLQDPPQGRSKATIITHNSKGHAL